MRRTLGAWFAILLIAVIAGVVRLPTVTAGWPYFNYVDEGYVLHKAVRILKLKSWDPGNYSYPTLPIYAIAGGALAYSPVYAALHDRTLHRDLSPSPAAFYDVLDPPELLAVGRLLTLLASLGLVAVTGLLARRLAGPRAGLVAAWFAALVPALVIRGAAVSVDPWATLFVIAALFFAEGAEGARRGPRGRRQAALAGAMTGLALTSKYLMGLAALPVALAVLLAEERWPERLRRLVLAGSAALLAAAAAMPALWLRTEGVLEALATTARGYAQNRIGSFWDQAVRRAEWDQPLESPEVGIVFLLLAAAGLLAALRDRQLRWTAAGWLLFAGALGLLVGSYAARPFRNLLPLVPLGCVLISLAYARLRERTRAADLIAVLLPVLLFAPALHQYVHHQIEMEDTRESAIRWLAAHVRPGEEVLFAREIAILPTRIASLPAESAALPWPRVLSRIRRQRFDWLVLGELTGPNGEPRIRPQLRRQILRNAELVQRFGDVPTPAGPGRRRGPRQIVYILKRIPRQP